MLKRFAQKFSTKIVLSISRSTHYKVRSTSTILIHSWNHLLPWSHTETPRLLVGPEYWRVWSCIEYLQFHDWPSSGHGCSPRSLLQREIWTIQKIYFAKPDSVELCLYLIFHFYQMARLLLIILSLQQIYLPQLGKSGKTHITSRSIHWVVGD